MSAAHVKRLLSLAFVLSSCTATPAVKPPDRAQVQQILQKRYGPGPPALEDPQAEEYRQQFLKDKQAYLADPSSFELPVGGPNLCPDLDPSTVEVLLEGEPLDETESEGPVTNTARLTGWRVVEGACEAGALQGEATLVAEVAVEIETDSGAAEGPQTSTVTRYHHLRGNFADSRLAGPYFHLMRETKDVAASLRRAMAGRSTPELDAIREAPWIIVDYGTADGATSTSTAAALRGGEPITSTAVRFMFQRETGANRTTVFQPLGDQDVRVTSYDGVDLATIHHARKGVTHGEWRNFARVSNRGTRLPAQEFCYENGRVNARVTCEGPEITGEKSVVYEQELNERRRRRAAEGLPAPPTETPADRGGEPSVSKSPAASKSAGGCDAAAAHQASIVAVETPSARPAMQKAFAQQCRDEDWSDARIECTRSAETADAIEACAKAGAGPKPASAAQCSKAAEHQAGIMSEKTPSMKPALQKAFEESCRSEGWTVARVECTLAADRDSQIEKCAAATSKSSVADKGLCSRAGAHQASIMAKSNPSMEEAFTKSFTEACVREKWTDTRAECVLAAKRPDQFEACK